jgi:curved DNA-binding protein CbpA
MNSCLFRGRWKVFLAVVTLQTFFVSVASFAYPSSIFRIYKFSSDSSDLYLYSSTLDNNGDEEERTLYDILNASPTDSPMELRQKYRALVRQTHPDAIPIESEKEQAATQFAKIAAAWNILSNPKERLRYDRTIKAKEFTSNVEDILEGGFRAAFQTAYQTAGGIKSVGEQLDQVRVGTGQRLEKARKIAEYVAKSRSLQQRSVRESARQEELQRRLANRERRHQLLQQQQQQSQAQKLTSNMANQVVKSFQNYDSLSVSGGNGNGVYGFNNNNYDNYSEDAVAKTIGRLVEMEEEHQQTTQDYQMTQKGLAQAQRKIDQAVSEEQRAIQRLEEAKANLEQLQVARQESERAYGDVLKTERVAFSQFERFENSLAKQQDRTREILRRTEDLYIWKENAYLKEESRKANNLSQKLLAKADELQAKADDLRREMDST